MYRLLAAAAALLVAGAANAQSGPEDGDPVKPLFISPAGEPFRVADGQPYTVSLWFAGADADGDGVLTLKEFVDDAARFFVLLDVDKDGRINSRETQRYEAEVAPEILSRVSIPVSGNRARRRAIENSLADRTVGGERTGRRETLAPRGAGVYGLLNEPQPVTAPDLDFNGIITKDEWARAAERRFRRLDTDGDFKLRRTDLPKPPAQQILERAAEPGRRSLF